MPDPVEQLLEHLQLERIEENLYRGESPQVGWQRIFGGLVVCQALIAAGRTVDDERTAHSLHSYFLRPGDPAVPIVYQVDRIRDGSSFTTRRVIAIQHGKAIFSLAVSFQKEEEGLEHFIEMPDVPKPEDLPSEQELAEKYIDKAPQSIRNYWQRKRPIELRPTNLAHYFSKDKLEPVQHIWFRATGPLPDVADTHQAVLAYASDMTLLDTSLFAHGRAIFDPQLQVASLDHSMWFHRPTDMTKWHLYTQDSPSASGSRGFTRGSIYSSDGVLVASVVQEGLIRLRTKTPDPKKSIAGG